MANDTQFVNGLIVKAPHENAPEYVKAKLSIKRLELIAWLQTLPDEWVNAEVKVSQNGKWYAAVDTWKPNEGGGSGQSQPRRDAPQQQTAPAGDDGLDDDIPF